MGNIPNWILLIVQLLSTAVMGGFGFFMKKEMTKSDRTASDLQEFKTKVAEEYVRKEDYSRNTGEILQQLSEIRTLLLRGGQQ